MEKLFHKKTEIPVNGSYYYLIKKYGEHGNIVGEGKWEEDNQCFYDNTNDEEYYLDNIDYYMEMPDDEQLEKL